MTDIKKQFNFEIKQLGEEKDRVLRFVGSTEDVDRDSDIIEVAGWKTATYMKNPVVLWSHNRTGTPPVGKTIKVERDTINKKLMFDIKFPTFEELSSDVDNPAEHAKFVDMIYNMCKNGYLNATSVGFRGIKFKTRDDPDVLEKPEWQRGRRYIEQELTEISIVNIPANQNALIDARGKGLISETQIKSFFMQESEKSGARLSKETMETLKSIKEEMQGHMETHMKAHKTAMKAYKGCMDNIDKLMGNEPREGNTDEPEPDETPKAATFASVEIKFDGELKTVLEGITARLDAIEQKDASKSNVIDLESMDIAKLTGENELNIDSANLSKMIGEEIQKAIRKATGKID